MLKTIKTKIKSFFESEEDKTKRDEKNLLRENLALVPIDIFYIDDPVFEVPEGKKIEYYKKFHDLCLDKDIMERIKFLINKQARLTLERSRDGTTDTMGSACINGIASVKDDFERMGNSYLKETAPTTEFNKYKII